MGGECRGWVGGSSPLCGSITDVNGGAVTQPELVLTLFASPNQASSQLKRRNHVSWGLETAVSGPERYHSSARQHHWWGWGSLAQCEAMPVEAGKPVSTAGFCRIWVLF